MGSNNKRKTTDEFKKEVYELVGDEFEVLGEYKNTHTKILMKHCLCGCEFEISPTHFISGTRCSKCSYKKLGESKRIKPLNVYSELLKLGFTALDSYETSNKQIHIKCNKCGMVFYTKARYIINKQNGCPKCNVSHGERIIKEFLESRNIKFEQNFRIPECKDKRPLPFDFKVETPNGFILIEYDGEQHFKRNFKNLDILDEVQKHDKIKTNFCNENNIKLIRIKYTERKNINKILEDNLF